MCQPLEGLIHNPVPYWIPSRYKVVEWNNKNLVTVSKGVYNVLGKYREVSRDIKLGDKLGNKEGDGWRSNLRMVTINVE